MEHKRDMKNPDRAGTAFCNKVRALRDAGKSVDIDTRIIRGAHPYKTGDSNCDLCLMEKTCITLNHRAPEELLSLPKECGLLNVRTEIIGGCQHKIDFKLIGRKNSTRNNR